MKPYKESFTLSEAVDNLDKRVEILEEKIKTVDRAISQLIAHNLKYSHIHRNLNRGI